MNSHIKTYAVLSIVIFQITCSIYSLDLTDQGYFFGNIDAWKSPYFFVTQGSASIISIFSYLFGDYAYSISKITPGILILVLIWVFSWSFETKEEKKQFLFYVVLLLPWYMRSSLSDWTYYSTLTGFFLTLMILFTERFIKSRQDSLIHFFFSFLLLSIWVKITNIVFLICIPVVFVYTKNKNTFLKNGVLWILIITTSAAYVFLNDNMLNYISTGMTSFIYFLKGSQSHSGNSLAAKNIQGILLSGKASFIFCIYLFIQYYADKRHLKLSTLFNCLICGGFVYAQFKWALIPDEGLFIFYLCVLTFLTFKKDTFQLTYILTLIFLIFCSIGSSNGIKATFISEPLIIFLILRHFRPWKNPSYKFVTLFLVLSGVLYKINFPYRDQNRLNLDSVSKINNIKGIITSKKKLEVIDMIKSELPDLTKTEAIIYPSAPLLHHILEISPYLDNPWINLYPPAMLNSLLVKKSQNKKPDVIIRLMQNPRNRNWPNGSTNLDRDLNREAIEILDNFTLDTGLRLQKENEYFKIYY